MQDDLDEINELLSLVQNVRGEIAEVNGVQKNGRASRYEKLLRFYLTAKIELDTRGLLVPSIQVSGLNKLEIVDQILETGGIFSEHFRLLHSRRDALEAELTYQQLVSELSSDFIPIGSIDSDLLALNNSQKDVVHEKLGELRQAINSASWSSDEHKQRVLDKINDLQRELDREVSSYARNLGKIVELGDAIGEFGKRVKPATERLKDITESLKVFKKKNAQIEKQPDPLKIEDLREQIED